MWTESEFWLLKKWHISLNRNNNAWLQGHQWLDCFPIITLLCLLPSPQHGTWPLIGMQWMFVKLITEDEQILLRLLPHVSDVSDPRHKSTCLSKARFLNSYFSEGHKSIWAIPSLVTGFQVPSSWVVQRWLVRHADWGGELGLLPALHCSSDPGRESSFLTSP
jgi:hypothetical protein